MKSTFRVLMAVASAVLTLVATVCLAIAYWEMICKWLDYLQASGCKLWKKMKECLGRHIIIERLAEDDDGVDESCFAD